MNMRVITLCALAVVAGCQKDSGTAPVAGNAAHARSRTSAENGPTAEEMTAGMVEAVTQGKSQAPITVKFDLPKRPVEGQSVQIAIALLPQIAASKATVDVSGADGLQLATGDDEFEFASVEPTQVYRHSIKVTPSAEGVYLLTLNVSLKHELIADTRVFSVPIIVGSAMDAPASAAQAVASPPPGAPAQHRGQ